MSSRATDTGASCARPPDVGAGRPGADGIAGDGTTLNAHHILERRLWPDDGYYVANGVSLCPHHHLLAEYTLISCETLRERAGITDKLLPPHLDEDGVTYDRWGNEVLPNGQRLRGELFDDPAVQAVLNAAGLRHVFTTRVKYPKTFHLPWSPGLTHGDKILTDLSAFQGQRVVVTVKMDGESTTMYHDFIHARSLDSRHHPSRAWVKALHATIRHDIPRDWRVVGENLYAQHSIRYEHLHSYFQVHSIWTDWNICLDWDHTREWCELLGLSTAPVLYDGPWDETTIRGLYRPIYEGDPCEGYVVRVAGAFPVRAFRTHVAKMVRAGHIQTDAHWMNRPVVPNRLRAGAS